VVAQRVVSAAEVLDHPVHLCCRELNGWLTRGLAPLRPSLRALEEGGGGMVGQRTRYLAALRATSHLEPHQAFLAVLGGLKDSLQKETGLQRCLLHHQALLTELARLQRGLKSVVQHGTLLLLYALRSGPGTGDPMGDSQAGGAGGEAKHRKGAATASAEDAGGPLSLVLEEGLATLLPLLTLSAPAARARASSVSARQRADSGAVAGPRGRAGSHAAGPAVAGAAGGGGGRAARRRRQKRRRRRLRRRAETTAAGAAEDAEATLQTLRAVLGTASGRCLRALLETPALQALVLEAGPGGGPGRPTDGGAAGSSQAEGAGGTGGGSTEGGGAPTPKKSPSAASSFTSTPELVTAAIRGRNPFLSSEGALALPAAVTHNSMGPISFLLQVFLLTRLGSHCPVPVSVLLRC
jgi:hypothetical protein